MPKSFSGDAATDPVEADNSNLQGTPTGTVPKGNDNSLQGNGSDGGNGSPDIAILQKRVNDSQEFINTLKAERQSDLARIQALSDELAKRPSMQEILDQINQQGGSADHIDPADLINKAAEAVDQRLAARQAKSKEDANILAVSTKLQSLFGADKVDAEVSRLAKENDMTFDEVFELARRNPKAAYKLLGVKDSTPVPAGTTGTLNPDAVARQLGNLSRPAGQNLMKFTTDRDRVQYFNDRMKQGLAQLNQQ